MCVNKAPEFYFSKWIFDEALFKCGLHGVVFKLGFYHILSYSIRFVSSNHSIFIFTHSTFIFVRSIDIVTTTYHICH